MVARNKPDIEYNPGKNELHPNHFSVYHTVQQLGCSSNSVSIFMGLVYLSMSKGTLVEIIARILVYACNYTVFLLGVHHYTFAFEDVPG